MEATSQSKPFGLAGMEPAVDIEAYDAVPWFRKKEFALFPLFVPATILIALTGDIFTRPNKPMQQHSDAQVWRYTRGSRAFFVVLGAIVMYVVVSALV